jgi:hypothetical protein
MSRREKKKRVVATVASRHPHSSGFSSPARVRQFYRLSRGNHRTATLGTARSRRRTRYEKKVTRGSGAKISRRKDAYPATPARRESRWAASSPLRRRPPPRRRLLFCRRSPSSRLGSAFPRPGTPPCASAAPRDPARPGRTCPPPSRWRQISSARRRRAWVYRKTESRSFVSPRSSRR